ncbi:MAG: hypothetical protein ACTSWN_16615 [Promethearchaeota archaeon]
MDVQDALAIKDAITQNLVLFDRFTKMLASLKKGNNQETIDKESLLRRLRALEDERREIRQELSDSEYIFQEMIKDKKNSKKIELQFQKINSLKKELESVFASIKQIKSNLALAENTESVNVDELQQTVKDLMERLQKSWQNYPDIYKAAERDTKIYFFTSPK